MSNLDESIGKILLDLQKDDPDLFKKLMNKAQENNPELFEDVDSENKEIEKYNLKIDEYNKKQMKNNPNLCVIYQAGILKIIVF